MLRSSLVPYRSKDSRKHVVVFCSPGNKPLESKTTKPNDTNFLVPGLAMWGSEVNWNVDDVLGNSSWRKWNVRVSTGWIRVAYPGNDFSIALPCPTAATQRSEWFGYHSRL